MRMECPEVFYTYEWAGAAARAFRGLSSPLVLLVYDSEILCGIAALATRADAPGTASFLTGNSADYCDVLSEPALRSKVIAAILREIKRLGIHDLELANIPSHSATLRDLRAIARSRGFRVHQRPAYDCRLVVFVTDQQRKKLVETIRQGSTEKRALKRMERLGPLTLRHLSNDEVRTELRSIFSAQISRFLATERISPLVRPERRLLMAELTQRLGDAGWLKVSRLEIGGHPAAWNFGFRFCESLFWYLPTFAMEYQDLSPGSCLLRLLIEDSCSDPSLQRLDLGLGEEAYKERYANSMCATSYVQLSTSGLSHNRTLVRYWLSRRVQRSPVVESTVRGLRDFARDLRTRIRNTGLPKTATHAFWRVFRAIRSSDEVLLFEAPTMDAKSDRDLTLTALDWEGLANIAVESADDPETLKYLMRCAARLKEGAASGFVLRTPDGHARHVLWTRRYDGFHLSEVNNKLESPDPAAIMIFDCWTPLSQRGHGYYPQAVRLAAALLQRENKNVWIFSSTKNPGSLRGISKAGFVPRTCLVRKSWFGYAVVTSHPVTAA